MEKSSQIWITPSRFGNALPKLVEDEFLLYPFRGIRKNKFMPVIHDFVLERFCFLFFVVFPFLMVGLGGVGVQSKPKSCPIYNELFISYLQSSRKTF